MSVELGRLVQQRRDELSLSRRDLAAASGVSYPYVSQIETGDRDPSLKTLRKLADILEIPMESMASLVSPENWMTSGPPVAAMSMSDRIPAPTDSADLYREKVLPAVERRLQSVPPLVRLQLLNELIAAAVEELQRSDR